MFRALQPARIALSISLAIAALVLLLTGCGGGGGGATGTVGGGSASSSTGGVMLRFERGAQKLPAETRTVRATVVGTQFSASAPFGPDVTSVTISLQSPLGPQTIRIEALDAAGNVIATGEVQVVVGTGDQNTVTVDSNSLLPSVVPTPTPAPVVLRFSVPGTILSMVPFQVDVQAIDATTGQVATGFSGAVTLALLSNPGGDAFAPPPVQAVNGVASFSGLTVANPGSGYQLVASASGATSGTSNVFNVVKGSLKFVVQPAGVQPLNGLMLPQPGGIQVAVVDGSGQTLDVSVPVVMGADTGGSGALGGTLQKTTVHGKASFTDLIMQVSGRNKLVAYTGPRSANVSAISDGFGVGPAIAQGTAYLLLSSASQTSLGAYDLNTGLTVATEQPLAFNPIGMSIWAGPNGPVVLVLGTDGKLHFFDGTSLTPTGPGTVTLDSLGALQQIKGSPYNDVFYVTDQSDGDYVQTVDMSSWPAPAVTAFGSTSSGGICGIAVDPSTSPSFSLDAGSQSATGILEAWTVSGASLSGPTPNATVMPPPQDTNIDVYYADTQGVAIVTYGNQTPAGGDGIFVTNVAASALDATTTAFATFVTGSTKSDRRKNVRFYASMTGFPVSTATALVSNQTTNHVEVAVATSTIPSAARPRPARTVSGAVIANVVDDDGVVSNPGPIALAKDATGTFVQGLVTCPGVSRVPLINLLDNSTPYVYGAITLPSGTSAFGAAVYQAGQHLTGQ